MFYRSIRGLAGSMFHVHMPSSKLPEIGTVRVLGGHEFKPEYEFHFLDGAFAGETFTATEFREKFKGASFHFGDQSYFDIDWGEDS